MPESSAALFDQHHLAVFRYLLRLLGRRDVAEDLTQEVFVRVVRHQERYTDCGQPRAWLLRIARNLAIDWQRARHRTPEGADVDVPDRAPGPDLDMALRQALAALAHDDREVFLLRTIGGLGHHEIATIVGATPAAVRCRIHRARARLRQALEAPHP